MHCHACFLEGNIPENRQMKLKHCSCWESFYYTFILFPKSGVKVPCLIVGGKLVTPYKTGVSFFSQPKQCIVIKEIPQNCHRFALLDSPKMGPI